MLAKDILNKLFRSQMNATVLSLPCSLSFGLDIAFLVLLKEGLLYVPYMYIYTSTVKFKCSSLEMVQ